MNTQDDELFYIIHNHDIMMTGVLFCFIVYCSDSDDHSTTVSSIGTLINLWSQVGLPVFFPSAQVSNFTRNRGRSPGGPCKILAYSKGFS